MRKQDQCQSAGSSKKPQGSFSNRSMPKQASGDTKGTPSLPGNPAPLEHPALVELAGAISRLTERLAEVEANVVLVFKGIAALRATVGTPVGRHASESESDPAPTVHQLLVRFAKRLDTNEAHVTDLLHIAEEALEGLDLSDLIGATSAGGVEPDKSEDDVPFMDEVRYDERPLDVD